MHAGFFFHMLAALPALAGQAIRVAMALQPFTTSMTTSFTHG
jgi:hypothetical protein